jgi:hypothetical protein
VLSIVLSKSVVSFLRRLVRLLGAILLVAACGGSSYTAEEISHALTELQPPDVGMTWGEFFVSCALDAGISVPLTIDELGSVEARNATARDEEIMQECSEQGQDAFVFPEIDDRRLTLVAMYQLQVLAAECVEFELGLDANLPTLERYVDTGGDWNMYDNSEPVDEAQWTEWNETCPQDLWHYYRP